MIKDIIKKAEELHTLEKEEIVELLADNSINEELSKAADRVRQKIRRRTGSSSWTNRVFKLL